MDINPTKIICFSPTGTSKTIARAVARGLGQDPDQTEALDITRPEIRRQRLRAGNQDLLLVAVPVYGGRVPALVVDWLNSMTLEDTPVICLVVYGNRAFEDALLELADTVQSRGGIPVAGGAFIAEHSFSSDERPIAVARPDGLDLAKAEALGKAIGEKLGKTEQGAFQAVEVPGNHPYKDRVPPMTEPFIALDETCTKCGTCEEICPVEAIDLARDMVADMDKCIRCCACIKVCPESARSIMPDTQMMEISQWLTDNCRERKEPEHFL